MKNRSYTFWGIILMCLVSFHTQAQYFQVEDLDTLGNDFSYDFPLLKGSPAAKKINDYLWAFELNAQPEKSANHPFDHLDIPAGESPQGTTDLSYEMLRNDKKLFSVRISSEYLGASINDYDFTLNFDSKTGNLVFVKDLFTPDGYKAIVKKVMQNRSLRLKKYLETLDTTGEDSDPETYLTYTNCLCGMEDYDLSADAMNIRHDTLQLRMPSCGDNHYFQATDDAPVYKNDLTYKELQPYLSPYGKCLLSEDGDSYCSFPENEAGFRGVYYGKINQKYPITVVILGGYGDTFDAVYFYDKQGKPIDLSGTFSLNGKIEMKEQNILGKKMTGVFKLKSATKGGFIGTWSDEKNSYPVYLK